MGATQFDCFAYMSRHNVSQNWGIMATANSTPIAYLENDFEGFKLSDDNVNKNMFRTNVTRRFIWWFKAGFYLQLLGIISSALAFIAISVNSKRLLIWTTTFLYCSQCLLGVAWFSLGQVIRWRESGMICTGVSEQPAEACLYANCTVTTEFDQLPGVLKRSGHFMQWWFYFIYGVVIAVCLTGMCGLVVGLRKTEEEKPW